VITVVGPKEVPGENCNFPFFVNTTSHSTSFGKGLSPFTNGPCGLYLGAPSEIAYNIENLWQYSKVYFNQIGSDGLPNSNWYKWARNGFQLKKAIRYPRGKGAIPEYHFWDGKKLDKFQARKEIYIPAYKEVIKTTDAFKQLCDLYEKEKRIMLWCFDGYDRKQLGMSIDDVINNPNHSMGHSFVLEMMLLEYFGGEL
jgi:hypothetical protein